MRERERERDKKLKGRSTTTHACECVCACAALKTSEPEISRPIAVFVKVNKQFIIVINMCETSFRILL